MANDPGPSDWNNPARRYKWFRPREAMRGQATPSTAGAGDYNTKALYNDSTGPIVLVVRHWNCQVTAAGVVNFFYNQGRLTGTNYPAQPLYPGDALKNGLVDYSQPSSAGTPDFAIYLGAAGMEIWRHEYPFAILPPGWSLVIQAGSTAAVMGAAFLWECVRIDELDYFY